MIKIRELNVNYIELISYLQPEGWSDITPFFRFFYKHDFCYPIVALDENRIVGAANATVNGTSGWLSHIIVAKDYRHRGIGYKLTEHLINYLRQKGCQTLLLIATKMGEGLYRKFGFETVSEYLFFNEGTIRSEIQNKSIRCFNNSDLEEMLELDRRISGENREKMLTQFLSNACVYDADSQIHGFFLPEFKEGMIIADNNQAGTALLNFKHSQQKRKTVLPVENKKGMEFMLSHGFKIIDRAPRMVLGEDIQWKPELVFSRAGGFYG